MTRPTKTTPLPFLGLACAVGVSSLYYNQPLLVEMGNTFHASSGATGYVAMATQVGYSFGLLLFVPLGDVMERRTLMMRMYGAVSCALLFAAMAPSLHWLIVASVLVGFLSAVTHIVLPLAPDLVSDEERGRAIGVVMTGLLLGVLLARTFAGWLARFTNWRAVFVVAAVMNLAFVPLLRWKLPKMMPKQDLKYGEAMRSLWTLWRTQPLLRESAFVGAMVMGSFSCFWTTLAFLLSSHYGLGSDVAGTFGVVGAAGVLAAPVAGKLADKRGPRAVLSLALATLAVSFVVLWVQQKLRVPMAIHMIGLVIGVIVLDLGAQMSQVANQVRFLGLVPSARSRLNTVYMTVYFSGAAAASASATFAWVHWGWNGVCSLGMLCIALAGLRHITGHKDLEDTDKPSLAEEVLLEG